MHTVWSQRLCRSVGHRFSGGPGTHAINPIAGVYAYMVGGFSGAFFTSSVSMSIQATSAMALIVATVPEVSPSEATAQDALFILTLLTGAFMVGLGLLRLGSILRFVPDSVMAAFTQAVGLSRCSPRCRAPTTCS